jgi:hypothetical protein
VNGLEAIAIKRTAGIMGKHNVNQIQNVLGEHGQLLDGVRKLIAGCGNLGMEEVSPHAMGILLFMV